MIISQLRKICFMLAAFALLGVIGTTADAQVTTYIACDNYYALYYTDSSGALKYSSSCTTGCIASAHTQTLTMLGSGSYIYIVAWGDKSVAQGLLASATGAGNTVLSGNPLWQVYPAKANWGAPNTPGFDSALAAVVGSSTTPWVAPTLSGNVNGATSPPPRYPVTSAGFPAGAQRWMWYKSPQCPGVDSPFQPWCNHGEYLVFRLPVKSLVPPPCLSIKSNQLCCLGQDTKGKLIISFSFLVNNPFSTPVMLNMSAPNVTINTYSPATVPPGTSMVTGTFTYSPPSIFPPPTNICFVFKVTMHGGVCEFKQCFKPPCLGDSTDNPNKTTGATEIEREDFHQVL